MEHLLEPELPRAERQFNLHALVDRSPAFAKRCGGLLLHKRGNL